MRIGKITIMLIFLILSSSTVFGEVLFEENFDSLTDWELNQSTSGATITCINGQSCSTPIPGNFYDYRIAATESCSNLDGNHNTMNINSLQPRGSSGKSFMFWNEPCYSSGGSWGSDGLLGMAFTPQNEVYVSYWIKFQADWRWNGDGSVNGVALGAAIPSPMQKFLHLSHLDTSNTNYWDFFSGTQNKPRFTPQLAKWGGGSYRIQFNLPHSPLTAARDSSASFNTDVYLGASPLDWFVNGSGTLAPGDGNWHNFQFYVKLNSAGGTADGVSKVWYDGNLIATRSNVVWIPTGDNPDLWKWNHAWLGGNNANIYIPKAEQWYAIDDVVVSTTYVPLDYAIGNVTTSRALNGNGSNGNNGAIVKVIALPNRIYKKTEVKF